MNTQFAVQARGQSGRWSRRGRTIVLDLDPGNRSSRQGEVSEEVLEEISSPNAVIDPRIDVHAQYSLLRMAKDPAASADASAMLAAVKSGQLAGIYKEDQLVPAQRAQKKGIGWWQVLQPGQDAAVVRDPGAAPMIVFRDSIRSVPSRLDPALLRAWREFSGQGPGLGQPADIVLIPHPREGFIWSVPRGTDATASLATRRSGQQAELDLEIITPDERQVVRGTLAVPFRFICSLEMNFGSDPDDPSQDLLFSGSGTLIGPRHVLTAAHNLLDIVQGSGGTRVLRQAARVTVFPARNGIARDPAQQIPAGPFTGSGRVSRAWAASRARDAQADFGLITLNGSVNSGFWGTENTQLRAIGLEPLRLAEISISGYPGDKCLDKPDIGSATEEQLIACAPQVGSTQWIGTGRLREPVPAATPGIFFHTVDTFGGMSGSPVWINTAGVRIMIGIHTGARRGAGLNRAVRISEALLNEIRGFMQADGVRPTF